VCVDQHRPISIDKNAGESGIRGGGGGGEGGGGGFAFFVSP